MGVELFHIGSLSTIIARGHIWFWLARLESLIFARWMIHNAICISEYDCVYP